MAGRGDEAKGGGMLGMSDELRRAMDKYAEAVKEADRRNEAAGIALHASQEAAQAADLANDLVMARPKAISDIVDRQCGAAFDEFSRRVRAPSARPAPPPPDA